MQAIGDWVILQPIEKEQKGLIIVPEGMEAKADADFALVISASETNEDIREGDIVLLLLGSCLELPDVDGQKYITSRKDRVICVVERADG